MKEEWAGQNYMSNKGSHLKSPAHICRKCLIAFRKVLQWVTSASKSFSHPAANYVSSGAKCHTTLLFFSTIPSSCENLHKHVSLDSSNALRDQNVSVYNFNKPYHSTPRPTISTKATRLILHGRLHTATTMHIHTAPLILIDV